MSDFPKFQRMTPRFGFVCRDGAGGSAVDDDGDDDDELNGTSSSPVQPVQQSGGE